jgi:hypothetical protein
MKEYIIITEPTGSIGKKYSVDDLIIDIVSNEGNPKFYDLHIKAIVPDKHKILKDNRLYISHKDDPIFVKLTIIANIFGGERIRLLVPKAVVTAIKMYDGKHTYYKITSSARIPKGGYKP